MFILCVLLTTQLLSVTDYQLAWNSHLAAALLYICLVVFALLHIAAACTVAMLKRGTATTKG